MHLILRRTASGPDGTFGMLCHGDKVLCLTLEDPPNDNQVGISCILPDTYPCSPHNGPRFKGVWRLEDKHGRKDVLIHNGNTIEHTRGCILVGMGIGMFNGLPGITNSQMALNFLRNYLPRTFTLEIIGV